MAVGVGGGELHTGWVHGTFGTLTLARGQIQSEAENVTRGNRGIGEPYLVIECHVEFGSQADSVEGDDVISLLLCYAKVEDL